MDMARLARLGVLLGLGERSWLLLPPESGLFPNGFVDASDMLELGPNNCSSAGGGNDGGGVGENDDDAGVIMLEFVEELGIRGADKNDVSSGVMAKSLGIFDVELLALRRFAGPLEKEGDAGRERC
jgi:hypothetical protein